MNDLTPISEQGAIVREALQTALSSMLSEDASPVLVRSREVGTEFGKRWISALHDGFERYYGNEEQIAVFSKARRSSGIAQKWQRSEYLYDLTVVEAASREAPIHKTALVPVITRALWQVESEMGLSAVDVAEDLGKLVLGSAASKLLIVARPADANNLNPWVEFIGRAAEFVPNNFFLAMMPTYSTAGSAHEAWIDRSAQIALFRRVNGKLAPDGEPISIDCTRTAARM